MANRSSTAFVVVGCRRLNAGSPLYRDIHTIPQIRTTTALPRPAPTPPRQPLQLPPNFRDVTAEKIGTVTGIVGAAGAKATQPRGPTLHRPPQERTRGLDAPPITP